MPKLLIASHIIPWTDSGERRVDPTNGLSLNALHDRAFDRGLITFDEQYRMVVSRSLEDNELGRLVSSFKVSEGARLAMPERFEPSSEAMRYHREHVFQDA